MDVVKPVIRYQRAASFHQGGQPPLEAILWEQADEPVGGEGAWLLGKHRSNDERKYRLSNLPADTPIRVLAGAIKARWICKQAQQQFKQEPDWITSGARS